MTHFQPITNVFLDPARLLPEDAVIVLLPAKPEEVSRFLHRLTPDRSGAVPRYRWGDILALWQPPPEEPWMTTSEAASRARMSEDTLLALRRHAWLDHPGSPVTRGLGKQRRHLSWPRAELDGWLKDASPRVTVALERRAPGSSKRLATRSTPPSRQKRRSLLVIVKPKP